MVTKEIFKVKIINNPSKHWYIVGSEYEVEKSSEMLDGCLRVVSGTMTGCYIELCDVSFVINTERHNLGLLYEYAISSRQDEEVSLGDGACNSWLLKKWKEDLNLIKKTKNVVIHAKD